MAPWHQRYAREAEMDERLATEAEAHAEWHSITGRKYGCPQDACHAPDIESDEEIEWGSLADIADRERVSVGALRAALRQSQAIESFTVNQLLR